MCRLCTDFDTSVCSNFQAFKYAETGVRATHSPSSPERDVQHQQLESSDEEASHPEDSEPEVVLLSSSSQSTSCSNINVQT